VYLTTVKPSRRAREISVPTRRVQVTKGDEPTVLPQREYLRVLAELAKRNGASVAEELRRRKFLPAIAHNVRTLMGWDALRCLRVADALYQRNRGGEMRPGAQPIEAQRLLAGAAFASVLRWKIGTQQQLAPDEIAMVRALGLKERPFPWPARPRRASKLNGSAQKPREMEEGPSTAG
jgi:hypothetical protein